MYSAKPLMGTLANSDDPVEMQHNAAFHQILHCFLSLKHPSEGAKMNHYLVCFCLFDLILYVPSTIFQL